MNVVVVIADALRRDMLHGTSPRGPAMPKLSERFADWCLMDQCFSAAPWTLPSCTSVMTGRSSAVHEHFSHGHQLTCEVLTPQFGPHLVKAAIVNNSALAESSGLFGGFDEYTLLRDHLETFETAHRFLDAREADGKPYFLLLHSNLAHDYYMRSTREHYDWYFPDRDDWFDLGSRVLSWQGLSADERRTVDEMYRACVLALDTEVERFLARIDFSDTATAFIADHGEGFDYEQKRVHHGGRVHDDVLKVPCAIRFPESAPASAHAALAAARNEPTSLTDIMPTMLSVSGMPVLEGLEGRCLDKPVASGPRVLTAQDTRYLYLRSLQRLNTNSRGKNMSRQARWKNKALRTLVARDFGVRAVIDKPYKLVVTEFDGYNSLLQRMASSFLRSSHNGNPVVQVRGRRWVGLELFDLEADPLERVNLLLGKPELVRAVVPVTELDLRDAGRARLAELVRSRS